MAVSKIIGLGILGYLLLTSKKKVEQEEYIRILENQNEDLETKNQEIYEELDQYTEKKEDLEFFPELHIDISGGFAMSYLYLTVKNNSTKLSYKIGDFSARAVQALAYTANTFEPKKSQTLTIEPGREYRLLIWSRSYYKEILNRLNTPENMVFLPPQTDYFTGNVLNDIANYHTHQVHKNLSSISGTNLRMMCYEFPSGLVIRQLSATVYTGTDEKQDIIFNNIKGSLLVYTVYDSASSWNKFPGYDRLTIDHGYFPPFLYPEIDSIRSSYVNYYYNPLNKTWQSAEHEWIGENTHVFK